MSNQYYIDHSTCPSCGSDKIVYDLKAPQETAILSNGLTYSGLGPGGEYYSKNIGGDSISLWTKGEEHWTADELRAIADHQDWMNKRKAPIARPARAESII